ncbi:UPF0147 family protein [Candidatus Woesearchaeota archaeon]|nr:UPF0147 family protein [Candidatus Woesearchaeota archaeon]
MKKNEKLDEVFEAIDSILGDESVPKSVREKIYNIKESLENAEDLSLISHSALSTLESIGEDVNLPPFVRTRIFHISGLLETLN